MSWIDKEMIICTKEEAAARMGESSSRSARESRRSRPDIGYNPTDKKENGDEKVSVILDRSGCVDDASSG
jgi:hypothetical protein